RSSGQGFRPRAQVFWQDRDDVLFPSLGIETLQILLRADRSLGGHGWQGNIGPGVAFRRVRGSQESNDWVPTFDLSLQKGGHVLRNSLSYSNQDRRAFDAIDVNTLAYRLHYHYALARDEFGV